MIFNNSFFETSTIRDDEGIEGAILVDSILLREGVLRYGDKQNLIPKESLNEEFCNSLGGLLVFKEHPNELINAENFNSLVRKSIGTIISAKQEVKNGVNVITGTLRITDPNLVEEVRTRKVRGGSLGYYADMSFMNGLDAQVNLRPNHFCLTTHPRDDGVVLFNSTFKKGDTMDKAEVANIVKEVLNSQTEQDSVVLNKKFLNSFVKTLSSYITDEKVVSRLDALDSVDSLNFIDTAMSLRNIFKNESDDKKEENSEDESKENACDFEKENSSLKEKINSLQAELDSIKKNSEDKKEESNSEDESKENSESEDKKEESNSEDESKENSESEDKKEESSEEKTNSVEIKVPVTNSNDTDFSKLASRLNSLF